MNTEEQLAKNLHEIEAQARLSRHAPEMLTALEAIVNQWSRQYGRFNEAMPESPRVASVDEAVQSARAIIALAKGESL